MPPATVQSSASFNGYNDAAYPSRNIAFQAAGMITSIIEHLQSHDELRLTPAFMYAKVYILKRLGLIVVTVSIACSQPSSCMFTKCDHLFHWLSRLRRNECRFV